LNQSFFEKSEDLNALWTGLLILLFGQFFKLAIGITKKHVSLPLLYFAYLWCFLDAVDLASMVDFIDSDGALN
jgi:hypothetical protein